MRWILQRAPTPSAPLFSPIASTLLGGLLVISGTGGCEHDTSSPQASCLRRHHVDCLEGNARACARIAEAFYRGNGIPRSFPQAAHYYEEGCALGLGEACFRLGRMYELGLGIGRDSAAAVECYGMACVFSDIRGCYETGQVIERCRGTRESAQLVKRFYRLACERKDIRGCDALRPARHGARQRLAHRRSPFRRPDPLRPDVRLDAR